MRNSLLLAAAFSVVTLAGLSGCDRPQEPKADVLPASYAAPATQPAMGGTVEKLELSDAEWKKRLTAPQYTILRQHGTEPAFSGPFNDYKSKTGTFTCAGCDLELFSAATKFDSGTGWPSYYEPIVKGHVKEVRDESYGMVRTEVRCARCDGHLGHVFNDGPPPTNLRYCINGHALKLAGGEAKK